MLIVGSEEKQGSSDGIYMAIDIYLNKQRDLMKSEREEICAVLDCNKMFVFVLLATTITTKTYPIPTKQGMREVNVDRSYPYLQDKPRSRETASRGPLARLRMHWGVAQG
ncbi:phototropic-responsive NPH3 family protein [Tanacetum coccineum]